MANLPNVSVKVLWDQLSWGQTELCKTQSRNSPLEGEDLPRAAGLYKISWVDDSTWNQVEKSFHVQGAKCIEDVTIHFSERLTPCVLTIGKTTNLHERIRQHFGTNKNNNRMLKRLHLVMPGLTDEDIREICLKSLRVDYAEVSDWIERSLLESYGESSEVSIFDLVDAEH